MTLAATDPTPIYVIAVYLTLLLGLGALSSRMFRGTSSDYFVATRSIGPFLLLMSVFGTTMTAFALVGSTGKAYEAGIGVYGLTGRMEKSYRLMGAELESEYNPVEAGLARPRVKAANFIGKEAYLEARKAKPAAVLCTLTV